jgi:hypothetical protein
MANCKVLTLEKINLLPKNSCNYGNLRENVSNCKKLINLYFWTISESAQNAFVNQKQSRFLVFLWQKHFLTAGSLGLPNIFCEKYLTLLRKIKLFSLVHLTSVTWRPLSLVHSNKFSPPNWMVQNLLLCWSHRFHPTCLVDNLPLPTSCFLSLLRSLFAGLGRKPRTREQAA